MSIAYKIKKARVRFKQRVIKRGQDMAFKHMSLEQNKVFNMVKDLAIKYNEAIRFDPTSDEIIIAITKNLVNVKGEMLITLKGETVYIHNTTGFMSMSIPTEAYEVLVKVVEKQAHRERRKLKKEVKDRINEFLNKIIESDAE